MSAPTTTGRGRNSALLGPDHPLYAALAGAAVNVGNNIAGTYLRTCPACRGLGVLCEEHEAVVADVDGDGAQPPGYWQPAGPDDKTMVMPVITG